jgi:ribosomal protein S18 acetylase RimI-like enzyme
MEDLWKNDQNQSEDIINHVILYQEEMPVAVASSFNSRDYEMSYISNVGVRPDFRKRGLGGKVTKYCLEDSKQFGNQQAILTTENDDFLRKFYQGLGFQHLFDFSYYVKKSQ